MSATRAASLVLYAAAFAAGLVVEVTARREGSRVPTLAALCGSIMRYRVGRVPVGRMVILGFWWWLGWHLLAR